MKLTEEMLYEAAPEAAERFLSALPNRAACAHEFSPAFERKMETLLRRAGLAAGQVDALYVAGGFGTVLDLENAAVIGLIPAELVSRAHVLGNAALTGALLELLGPAGEETSILANAQCLNLSECKEFTGLFMEAMLFD